MPRPIDVRKLQRRRLTLTGFGLALAVGVATNGFAAASQPSIALPATNNSQADKPKPAGPSVPAPAKVSSTKAKPNFETTLGATRAATSKPDKTPTKTPNKAPNKAQTKTSPATKSTPNKPTTGKPTTPKSSEAATKSAKVTTSTLQMEAIDPNSTDTMPLSAPGATCITPATVAAWPLRRQAGHIIMVGVNISQAKWAKALVTQNDLGGLIIRGTPKATDAPSIIAIRDARPLPTIIAVDEEGGIVQHLKSAIGPLPPAQEQAKLTTQQLRTLISTHAKAMRAMGFTMVLGPVVDLAGGDIKVNGIGDRAYGDTPEAVVTAASAFAHGMQDGGIYPVLKHFPGHGHADGDTHTVGAKTPPWSEIKDKDVLPFKSMAADFGDSIGIMTSHLFVPGLDNRPTSISKPSITGVIRNDWGFDGLVITDSLSMWPIKSNFDAPHAALEALRAGNDLLVYDDDPGVAKIAETLAETAAEDHDLANRLVQSNLRVLRAAGANVCAGSLMKVSLPVKTVPTTTTATTVPAPTTTWSGLEKDRAVNKTVAPPNP